MIDDLDRSAIDYFLHKGIKAGRINEDEANASTQSVLENLHLLSEDGKLKNAALLLFAKNPQRYFTCVEFRIGRFRRDEADLISQDVIEGNIIQMTDRVVEILKTKYFTSPIHYEGMQRIETLEVPEGALREILYNSICHKDYTGVHIQMRVWDDYSLVLVTGILHTHSSRQVSLSLGDVDTRRYAMVSRVQGYLCQRLNQPMVV